MTTTHSLDIHRESNTQSNELLSAKQLSLQTNLYFARTI